MRLSSRKASSLWTYAVRFFDFWPRNVKCASVLRAEEERKESTEDPSLGSSKATTRPEICLRKRNKSKKCLKTCGG